MEAIAHLSKGLDLIGSLPNVEGQLDAELGLRLAIGGPLTAIKGYAAPEVEQTYSRAWALCEQLGRSAELFPGLRGLWNCHLLRGELQQAHDLSERLAKLAEEQGAPLHRARPAAPSVRRCSTSAGLPMRRQCWTRRSRSTSAVAALDGRRADLLLHTESAGVSCRLLSGRALWFLGFPDRALERVEAGLALAERLAHANTIGFALAWAGFRHNFRGEFAAAQRRAEAAIGFSSEHLLPQRLAQATMCRAFALVGLGRQAEGIAELRTGLAAWNGTGAHLLDSQWLGFIAEAHLRAAEFDEALTTLDGAAQTAVAAGDCHYQAELHRLKAVVLVATGNPAEAASCFQQAIDMAQSQQAKSLRAPRRDQPCPAVARAGQARRGPRPARANL